MKRIAVLTSGGDAPGMNAALRAVTRSALDLNIKVTGILDGFYGLIHEDFIELSRDSVSNIINTGGTILGSARLPEFKNLECQKMALQVLKKYNIEGLIVIGGDGSYHGALALANLGMPTIAIPGTIDNDIASTDYTIGFATACNTAVEAIDKLRDTSRSHIRCTIVEVMGRYCGDIAYQSGLAGGADLVITGETGFDREEVYEAVNRCKEIGKRHCIIVISEHVTDVTKLAEDVTEVTGFTTRATIIGHVQRGGSPTPSDRVLATLLGSSAVDELVSGKSGICMGMVSGKIVTTPINEALKMKKHLLSNYANIIKKVR